MFAWIRRDTEDPLATHGYLEGLILEDTEHAHNTHYK